MDVTIAEDSRGAIVHIWMQSTATSPAGGALTGLAYDTVGLVCYYIKSDDLAPTQISLVSTTAGTHTDGGFVEVDSSSLNNQMPGLYEFQIPDSLLEDGADDFVIMFTGAINLVPFSMRVKIEAAVAAVDPISDEQQIYSWRIGEWSLGSKLILQIEELKSQLLEIQLPLEVFTTAAISDEANFVYNSLGPGVEGKVVPFAYGKVRGATPLMVAFDSETTAYRFKVTSHAISSFDSFSLDGVTFTPTTTDVANGEFTYDNEDAATGEILVDFTAPLLNIVDVIEDILVNRAGIESTSLFSPDSSDLLAGEEGFGVDGCRDKWIRGTTLGGTDIYQFAISKYVNTSTAALSLCEELAQFAFAVFFMSPSGLYNIRAWEPVKSEDAPVFRDEDIFGVKALADATNRYTRVEAKYRVRINTGNSQVVVKERDDLKYRKSLPAHTTLTQEVPFDQRYDASDWATRMVAIKGPPQRLWEAQLNQRAIALVPGDNIRIVRTRKDGAGNVVSTLVDDHFEVIKVEFTPGVGVVKVTVSPWRGLFDHSGFWVVDSPVFSEAFGSGDLSPYNVDSLPWTDDEEKFARENCGWWLNDDEYASDYDIGSYLASAWV